MPSSSHPSIAAMQSEVRRLLPSLSRAQANVLGELVFAMLMVDGCGMTRICSYVSELLDQAMNTLRQKYREIYYEKEAKAGVKQGRCKRRELVVEELFADLLRGVLKDWQGPKTLVLALDASTLSDRLTVLSISVMDHPARSWGGGMATALGTHAHEAFGGRTKRVAGVGDGRPRAVCGLALSRHPSPGMASVPARQTDAVVSS